MTGDDWALSAVAAAATMTVMLALIWAQHPGRTGGRPHRWPIALALSAAALVAAALGGHALGDATGTVTDAALGIVAIEIGWLIFNKLATHGTDPAGSSDAPSRHGR